MKFDMNTAAQQAVTHIVMGFWLSMGWLLFQMASQFVGTKLG